MSGFFARLDASIQKHLRMIQHTSGLPDDDRSLEVLAEGWRDKEKAFDNQAHDIGMERAEKCSDFSRGFLALTYSGSLVAVGPEHGGLRRAVYVSIDRRQDVPTRAVSEDAVLDSIVSCGREIIFKKGPVKKSSAVYRLAVLPATLTFTDQHNRLDQATIALTKDFQAVDETPYDDSRQS